MNRAISMPYLFRGFGCIHRMLSPVSLLPAPLPFLAFLPCKVVGRMSDREYVVCGFRHRPLQIKNEPARDFALKDIS